VDENVPQVRERDLAWSDLVFISGMIAKRETQRTRWAELSNGRSLEAPPKEAPFICIDSRLSPLVVRLLRF
jgi:hypothetical protein